jgi:hypothetical protein
MSAGLTHFIMGATVALAVLPFFFALPDRPTPPGKVAASSAPETAPAASATTSPDAAQPAEPPKDEWPKEEIARATEQCTHVLSGLAAEVEYLEPIKKGECGLPAPVRLKSLGSEKKIVFDPPVDINCPMVAALDKWIKTTLQPNARERMKSEVAQVVNASGYSCRNVYGLPNAKLSQHALANAIDIGGFRLADGRLIKVLSGWGLTQRDIIAQAKAKAEAEAKAKAATETKTAKAKSPGSTAPATATEKSAAEKSGEKDAADANHADKRAVPITKASLTLLPGKTAADSAAKPQAPPKPTREALFLRSIHAGACKDFGTVLGPEANDPHRNHFHLDLTPRRRHGICE